MNLETIVKWLWPILKPRIVALLAKQLLIYARKFNLELTEADALKIAVGLVALLEDALTDDDTDHMTQKASDLLKTQPA